MRLLITCNGYEPIATVLPRTADRHLSRLCREAESRADGYAVVVIGNGRIMADADGLVREHDDNRLYRAQIDHACGYHD